MVVVNLIKTISLLNWEDSLILPNTYSKNDKMLKKINLIILILILCINHTTVAQKEVKDFVHEIDFSSVKNEGLTELKNAIGDAKLVLLGEQDHGDGGAFVNKIKLIKFLHQEMGFEVVAFESGFYSLNRVWKKALNNEVPIDSVKRNIYRVWRTTEQIQPLFDYVEDNLSTDKKLHITGFDCRHQHKYSIDNYVNDMKDFIASNNLLDNKLEFDKYLGVLDEFIKKEYNHKPAKDDKSFFYNTLAKITNQTKKLQQSENISFWFQELKSLKMAVANAWSEKLSNGINLRDQQMAENLIWLLKSKYPEKKVIVWAANLHIAKNPNQIAKSKYFKSDAMVTMGNEVFKELKDKMYSIGFTSLNGKYANIEYHDEYNIKSKKSGLENRMAKTNYELGFMNLSNQELLGLDFFKKPYELKGIFHREQKGNWHKVFDGIFYIKEMTPAKYVD